MAWAVNHGGPKVSAGGKEKAGLVVVRQKLAKTTDKAGLEDKSKPCTGMIGRGKEKR